MRILVPLDGTSAAEAALAPAARLLRALSDTRLFLLRVVELTPTSQAALRPPDLAQSAALADEACEDYLHAVARHSGLHGLPVECLVVTGTPAAMIRAIARSQQIDLIMMTSHGRTGLARLALGSIAEDVMDKSTIPTCVWRATDIPTGHAIPRRILVPLDGTSVAEAIIATVMSLALGWHAEMRLLQVLPSPSSDVAHDRDQIAAARGYLGNIQQRCEREGIAAEVSVTMGAPREAIIHAALHAQHPCDMIALASHGRTELAKLEVGSVTEYLMRHLHLPILVVYPQPAWMSLAAN